MVIEIAYKNGRMVDQEDSLFTFLETHFLLSKNYLLNRDLPPTKLINIVYYYIIMVSQRDEIRAFEFIHSYLSLNVTKLENPMK